MILYFADKYCNVVFVASTKGQEDHLILTDTTTDDLATAVKTLSISLRRTDETREITKVGNYILQQTDNGDNELYSIIETKYGASENKIEIYCEDAGLDLLNKVVGPWSPSSSKTIIESIQNLLGEGYNNWEVNYGIDTSIKKSKSLLEYTSSETVTSRLLSLLTVFDAEMFFSYDIEGLKVIKRYINIVEKRGSETPVHDFTYGAELTNITETTSIENLATSYIMHGVNSKNASVALSSLPDYNTYKDKIFDPDSDVFPTKRKYSYLVTGNQVRCIEGCESWSSGFNSDGIITRSINTNYTSARDCIMYAIRELEKVVDGEATYEIDFDKIQNGIDVGDYIRIRDEQDRLYLKSRVQKIEKSEISNSYKLELCDITREFGRKAQLVDISNLKLYSANITSSNGLISNGAMNTTLTASFVLNGVVIDNATDLRESEYVQWYEVINNIEVPIPLTDSRLANNGFSLNVNINETKDYAVALMYDIGD